MSDCSPTPPASERSWYFAYGSNLSRTQMRRRCPASRPVGVALLRGYRLAFTRYSSAWEGGVADVVCDEEGSVWGLLYAVSAADLPRLDGYEAYPHGYDRSRCRVEGPTGPVANVWVYTVVDKGDFIPPTRQYLSVITSAAAELDLPADYLAFLQSFPTAGS